MRNDEGASRFARRGKNAVAFVIKEELARGLTKFFKANTLG